MKFTKKAFLALAIFLSLPSIAFMQSFSFSSSPFSDTEGHHYAKSIDFIKWENVVNGYDDDTFKPNKKINRAELLKIIIASKYELEDYVDYIDKSCFNDVEAEKWYTSYACYAKEKGIIKGYSDNTFRPSQDIKFNEALKITLMTYGYEFTEGNPWYKDLIDQASRYNLIPLDITDFKQEITRGQMANMIARVMKKEEGDLEYFLGDKKDYVHTYSKIEKGENLLAKAENEIQAEKNREAQVDPKTKEEILKAVKGYYGSFKAKPSLEEINKYSADELPIKLFAQPLLSPIMNGISKKADEFKIKQYEENLAAVAIDLEESGSSLEDSSLLIRLAGNQWKVSSKIEAIEYKATSGEEKDIAKEGFDQLKMIEEIRNLKKESDGINTEAYKSWQKEDWEEILKERTEDLPDENPFDAMIEESKKLKGDMKLLLSAFSKYMNENTEPLQCKAGTTQEEAKAIEIPECDPDKSGKNDGNGAFEGALPLGNISSDYWAETYDCSEALTPKYIEEIPVKANADSFDSYSENYTGYWICQQKAENKIYILLDESHYNVETFEMEGECKYPGSSSEKNIVYCMSETWK